MINQAQWRSYFLAVASVGINAAVIYALIMPKASNRPVANYEFPEHLKINYGDKAFEKTGLGQRAIKPIDKEVIRSQQRYQYIDGETKMRLDISYLVGTRGDVETYLQNYTDLAPEIIKAKIVKQLDQVGYYTLFSGHRLLRPKRTEPAVTVGQDRAYLSSCISPRSLSNVTQKQFSQYRYQNDLRWQVGWDWLRGKASIRDRRCLWILLSTPVDTLNTQAAYQNLETVWKDVYQYWLSNFPPLTENQ